MKTEWLSGLKTLCRAECVYGDTGKTGSFFLEPETLEDAAKRLYRNGFFLEDITAADSSDGLVAVYHFDHLEEPGRVALYVIVPPETNIVPSISHIYRGAEWHERETSDFFGMVFSGNPDSSPLLLPEEMDFHPLLKAEGSAIPLGDFLVPGKVIDKTPEFAWFADQDPLESTGKG